MSNDVKNLLRSGVSNSECDVDSLHFLLFVPNGCVCLARTIFPNPLNIDVEVQEQSTKYIFSKRKT